MPRYLYSIVIFPTSEQLSSIKLYKQLLRKNINRWYNSVNSDGHITIIQFKTELDFLMYIDKIREFCKITTPQNVRLTSFNSFKESGAFFIAPDSASKCYLDSLIIDLHIYLDFKIEQENVNAHMSIGRKLFGEEMEIAEELFRNIEINMQFNCGALYVRKFNQKKRQYSDIIEKIDFGGKPY